MRQRDTMRRRIYCGLCSDTGWVCEDHIRTTWDACSCGRGIDPSSAMLDGARLKG